MEDVGRGMLRGELEIGGRGTYDWKMKEYGCIDVLWGDKGLDVRRKWSESDARELRGRRHKPRPWDEAEIRLRVRRGRKRCREH